MPIANSASGKHAGDRKADIAASIIRRAGALIFGALVLAGSLVSSYAGEPPRAEIVPITGHVQGVTAVAFSSDGALVASGSDDETVKLWDSRNGRLIRTLRGHTSGVSSIAISPDNRTLLSGSDDKTIRVWDATTGKLQHSLSADREVTVVAFGPVRNHVLSGDWSISSDVGALTLWDAESETAIRTIDVPGGVYSATFSHDGTRIASSSVKGVIDLWDAKSGERLSTQKLPSDSGPGVVKFSASEDQLYVGAPKFFTVISIAERRIIRSFNADKIGETAISNNSRAVVISGDGDKVFFGATRSIEMFNGSGALQGSFGEHGSYVTALAISTDGRFVLSGSSDETLEICELETQKLIRRFVGPEETIISFSLSQTGHRALVETWTRALLLWDLTKGRVLLSIKATWGKEEMMEGPADDQLPSSLSPDGSRLLIASADGLRGLNDASTGHELRAFSGNEGKTDFSSDGKQLSVDLNGHVSVYDATKGALKRTIKGSTARLSAPFSADGKVLLILSPDGNLRTLETKTWRIIRSFPSGRSKVLGATIAPDGSRIFAVYENGIFRSFDSRSGGILSSAQASPRPIDHIAVSSNTTRVALAGDGAVELFDVASGRLVRRLERSKDNLGSASFSQDGRRILVQAGGLIEVWEADTGNTIRALEGSLRAASHSMPAGFIEQCDCVVYAGDDGTLKLLEIPTGQILLTLKSVI